jgi:uncharacterized protein (TIGR03086 family)
MTQNTSDAMSEACATIALAVRGAAGTDLNAPTPCTDFQLKKLLTHFAGTSSAFARAGERHALDPDDPWGSKTELDEDRWPEQIAHNLETTAAGWSRPDAWEGGVEGSGMPATALGEMGLIEVMLHGWDVARASGQSFEVSPGLGAELLRCVSATAEQGREFEAYGPEVEIAPDASDFDKALGLAGRDPAWTA